MWLGSERLTMGSVFLRFGTSTIEPLPPRTFRPSLQTYRGCYRWRMGTFHLPAKLLAEWERKAVLKPPLVSHETQRFLSPRSGSRRRERGFGWKRRSQRSRLLVGSLKASFPGSSKGRKAPRSRRYSCQISHLWLCSTLAPHMRSKYNQQAQKYRCGWRQFNDSCWFQWFFLVCRQRFRTQSPNTCRLVELPLFSTPWFRCSSCCMEVNQCHRAH